MSTDLEKGVTIHLLLEQIKELEAIREWNKEQEVKLVGALVSWIELPLYAQTFQGKRKVKSLIEDWRKRNELHLGRT